MDSNVIKNLQTFSGLAMCPYLYNGLKAIQEREEVVVKLMVAGYSKNEATKLLEKYSLDYLYYLYNKAANVKDGSDISEPLERLGKKSSVDQWQEIKSRRKLFMNI